MAKSPQGGAPPVIGVFTTPIKYIGISTINPSYWSILELCSPT